MSDFIKISEEVYDDPKMLAVGPEGFSLYVKGLAYSKKHLLDGHVPTDALPLLGIGLKSVEKTAQALVARDLWERVEGGYRVKPERWSRWQRTKEQVEERREHWRDKKQKQRGKKGDKPAPSPEVSPGDKGGTPSETPQGTPLGSPAPVPITEPRVQSTELPSGSRTPAAGPDLVPLLGGWQPLGDWLDDPDLRRGLSRIEGNRSPGVAPVKAEQVGVLAEVLRTNHVALRDLVGVLDDPETKGWRKLEPEGVLRVWRRRLAEPSGNLHLRGNSGPRPKPRSQWTDEERAAHEAELDRIEAEVSR